MFHEPHSPFISSLSSVLIRMSNEVIKIVQHLETVGYPATK